MGCGGVGAALLGLREGGSVTGAVRVAKVARVAGVFGATGAGDIDETIGAAGTQRGAGEMTRRA